MITTTIAIAIIIFILLLPLLLLFILLLFVFGCICGLVDTPKLVPHLGQNFSPSLTGAAHLKQNLLILFTSHQNGSAP